MSFAKAVQVLGISEQGAEPFVLKVPVIGEDLGQPFLPHGLHRNAIAQTVPFIGPRSIKGHAGEK